jgi:tetratricopeptide (TPR) repeat protein
MDLNHTFQYHAPKPGQPEKYERLRFAFKVYAEALISDHDLTEEYDFNLELAYEDIIRVVNDLVPVESPEYDQAIKYIDQAYDLAIDPKRAIVQSIQAAFFFSSAAVALEK